MLTLSQIKKHLNIDDDYNGDDSYLNDLNRIVYSVVEKHINCSLSDLKQENKGDLPLPLQQAMLFLIGNFYANRESITFASANEIPLTYSYILDFYKNYKN